MFRDPFFSLAGWVGPKGFKILPKVTSYHCRNKQRQNSCLRSLDNRSWTGSGSSITADRLCYLWSSSWNTNAIAAWRFIILRSHCAHSLNPHLLSNSPIDSRFSSTAYHIILTTSQVTNQELDRRQQIELLNCARLVISACAKSNGPKVRWSLQCSAGHLSDQAPAMPAFCSP